MIVFMNLEAKSFYKSLCTIVGPIAAQNLISAAVSSVDVIMLGSVGQTAIAASSLANQITFILFMISTGLSSGLIMLSSQYWGKKDVESIKVLMGIALRISCSVGFIFGVLAFFCPTFLMGIFTNDQNLISVGSSYLKVASISFFCLSISQIFQSAFKSIERVKIVTILTLITLGLNVLLNSCFIYGFIGFPKLGIVGVGIATSISRVIEVVICLIYCKKQKDLHCGFSVIFKRNQLLFSDFVKFSMPAVGNELVWGAAFSMYSVILGHLGEDIVAANSVVGVIRNLATVVCFGMAYGGAIILGKQMGAGELEKAERNAARLAKVTILSGVLGGILVLCCRSFIPNIVKLSENASHCRDILMYITAYSIVGASINTVFICGIFRAGGDSKFGFIADVINMWGVSVPLGLLAAFVFKLPPLWVYFILYLDEFEKMPFVIVHYFKKKWLKNITREI
jgi:putative MATE family efflux protein